jgi:signal transduction histidine kinase/CheY-like chemotaxis protein
MPLSQDGLLHIIREPEVPPELRDRFRQEVDLSNSRRLKAVTWLLFWSLVGYLLADYFTVGRASTPQARDMWTGILVIRPVAMAACGVFLWLFGPLGGVEDLRPRHAWVWKVYISFFLVYTSVIVAFMFPLKMSISPVYIFMLGPPAFIAMTTRQATLHQTLGMGAVAASLYFFAPESATIRYHLINAMIISFISFIVAHVTYASTLRDFLNKHLIEKRNAQLEAARLAAEEASQAKSDFLAAVSHEIRTPMNAVLGMTEAALHTPLDARQRDFVGTARESALHLLDVLNDILDFSRIEAGKLRLVSEDFDLSEVMLSALKTVRFQAEEKGLDLDFEIIGDTPRYLKGDPGRLRQVLINLLGNGVKFTEQGYVRVSAGPWRGAAEGGCAGNMGLRFCVSDSGMGISPKLGDSIFEAFSQADGTSSRHYGGSGLGLAICRNLVRLMGGDIRVVSSPGRGSEFIFTACFGQGDPARAVKSESAADAIPADLRVTVKPAKVLLVDDNRTNVKVARLHLDRMGMTTVVAESGVEALMLLAEEDFDLVLMDLEMPGMDGHETVRRIRTGQGAGRPVRRPDIPVLAVTAHALGDVRQRCVAEGMDGLVTKPVSFGEMAVSMRDILGGGEVEEKPVTTQASLPVLDLDLAAVSLEVSRAEVRHLVPNAMVELRLKFGLAESGVRTGTVRETALQAHTIKSVAASIGAEPARRAALGLENAARREDLDLCAVRLEDLRQEMARLERAVAALD